jgi:hypothetical protein
MGEGDPHGAPPYHPYGQQLADRVFLDGHELGRQDDAHIQGHRDGLADRLA